MSDNYKTDTKLEMDQEQKHPLMDPPPPYPTDTYPSGSGPVTYPSVPVNYPSVPVHQGAYPPAQGSYPVTAEPIGQPIPIAAMEKYPVTTVCGHCQDQIVTSVNSSVNTCGVTWLIYGCCCCIPFMFFVMCMDHFKTWKHTCPACQKMLAEFTPKASGGTTCGLVYAVILNIILIILYVLGQIGQKMIEDGRYN